MTENETTNNNEAVREAHKRLGIWLFLRLFVPVGPIVIQYSLYGLGAYQPDFLQVTYITIMFSLSLATLTEYSDTLGILYLAVVPAIAATFLYTAALLVSNNKDAYNRILLTGFVLWLLLIILNIARVMIDWRKRLRETKRS